jgi:hypothetical protein
MVLEELLQCGFIRRIYPFTKLRVDTLYRLTDAYSLFYFRFLHHRKGFTRWQHLLESPAFKIWSGYAFENLCFTHIEEIKVALGIHGIVSNEYSWTQKGEGDKPGTQIDFIIDRSDNCINLLELKFHNTSFEMTRQYDDQLREKMALFQYYTHTQKTCS